MELGLRIREKNWPWGTIFIILRGIIILASFVLKLIADLEFATTI